MRDAQRYDLDPVSKVKVTGTRKLQNHPNLTSISFAKIRSIQRLMVDFYNTGQYLKFNRSHFCNSSSFFVTWPLNFVLTTSDKLFSEVYAIFIKLGIQVVLDERCTMVWPWRGSKVKVTGTRKLQNHPKSKSISFAKIRSIQRLMVDFYTTGQYLKFNWSHFWNSS